MLPERDMWCDIVEEQWILEFQKRRENLWSIWTIIGFSRRALLREII
jgi:hypothetical protein